MRRIVTAITAAAMALSLVSMAMPANAAVAGYDSAYAGESAFLTLTPGTSGTFTVFFQNTGTTAWAKGTASQVDLAACQEDKTTCNAQDASETPFMSGWLSTTRYATHTQTSVAPGSIGTFTYNVAVPSGQAAGTYRFNGALVLSGTGADIRNEGYYQDVTVPGAAAASCTPTGITLSPTFSQMQVGSTYTQTATVDCDAPTGSTTRPKASGAQITFVVDAPTGSLNADQVMTATTDANGVASVTWSRSNPDTDSVAAYPTAQPAVRGTATVRWTAAASGAVLTCTPTDSASAVNGTTRTYTVTVKNPNTGAAASGVVVDVKFSASTTATATTPTGSSTPSNTSGASQEGTTDSSGILAVTLTGTNTTASPIVFIEPKTGNAANDVFGGTENNNKDANEFNATCGTTTFAVQKATIAVTPDTAATVQNGGDRVYTVAATNTIGGGAFTSALRVSFTELTDSDLGTTTACTIDWVSNATTPATTPGTAGTGGRTAPTSTTNATVTPNTTGGFTFAVTGTTTSCNPIVWHDINGDTGLQTEEPQDTGGKVTFSAAGGGIASATLTSSATQPASSGEAAPATNNGSAGEKTFTFTLKDAQGNTVAAPTGGVTVNFTVTNTGTRDVYITAVNGTTVGPPSTTVAAGGSQTVTATIAAGASTASIEVDSVNALGDASNKNWASASIKGELASNTAISKTSTITWVVADPETAVTVGGTAQGTVLAVDTTDKWYLLDTPAGIIQIFWDDNDTFIVTGTNVTMTTFESNITAGDTVKFTNAGNADPAGSDTHEITTNVT